MTGTNTDLNELRRRVLGNQNAGDVRPTDPAKAVIVDREGKIRNGSEPAGSAGPATVVPQETFADRVQTDRDIARQFMPSNTREVALKEGVTGYSYAFTTELGDDFVLFAYFDGASYQVRVLKPEVEARFRSAQTGHLFSDGRICFGANYGSGMPTLRDAYAKSVLWANGMSIAIRTGHFPFSNNNT
jgi:hypothetical protein